MVWEYGAAISAIVVDDNTVTLTLTPGEKAGEVVQAVVEPAAQEFTVKNEVVTIGAKEKGDLRLTRSLGRTRCGERYVAGKKHTAETGAGDSRAGAACGHAAGTIIAQRGVQVDGKAVSQHEPTPRKRSGRCSRNIIRSGWEMRLNW